jgi:ribosome-binding protein aMBF1 (putative translation factor)
MMKKNKAEKIEKLASISKKEGGDAKWQEVAKWNRKHADALEDFVIIAGHIRKILKDKGWTQTELAKMLEVSPQALTRILKGRQNLTLQTIRKIENVLDVMLITVHPNKAMVTEKN